MTEDRELLRRYVHHRDESAFTEVVERHLPLVYGTALRETQGDHALAKDISQAVYLELANKAGRLFKHPALSGWLHTSTRLIAANFRRSSQRRRRRELLAMSEPAPHAPAECSAEQVRPAIDEALHQLNASDRSAVLLRFFQERSLREVGEALGVSENAARMRVDRAVARLRALLEARGIRSTASGLATAIVQVASVETPAGLGASLAATAMANAPSVSVTTLTFLKIMSAAKLKTGLVGSLLVVGVAAPLWQQARIQKLSTENLRLKTEVSQVPSLRAELDRVKASLPDPLEFAESQEDRRRLRAELARSRNVAALARRAETELVELREQLRQSEAKQAPAGNPFGALMSTALEQQTQGQLQRMQAKLNLSADQVEGIRSILNRQADRATLAMGKVFAGKLTSEDLQQMREEQFDPEGEIRALLSPEQAEACQEYKKEEAVSQARMSATSELLQMQGLLSLSPEQQDQAFGVLYDQTLRQLQGEIDAPPSADPATVMQHLINLKSQAMEGVLTPEQIEAYRQWQEAQIRFLQNVLPPPAEPNRS